MITPDPVCLHTHMFGAALDSLLVCLAGCGVEEVLRVEEITWRAGVHSQEPVQAARRVSPFSTSAGFW